jgi:arsenate reductase
MAITLHGIPNCDQVRKARSWLDANGVAYVFHDFRKAGITRDMVGGWLTDTAWDVLINRKGTTWRALADERKSSVTDAESATRLMLESPSIIKRPVLTGVGGTLVGFSEALYQQTFKK